MPRMCKDKQWDSILISDLNPGEEIPDGVITIEEELELLEEEDDTEERSGKVVLGRHELDSTTSRIIGICAHDSSPSRVRLRRGIGADLTLYRGFLRDGEEDISDGRYKRPNAQIDPDEGTWVATSTGLAGNGGTADKEDEKEGREELTRK